MWHKEYRDYKPDEPLIKKTVEPGHGLFGCEMHEINGWGNSLHHPKPKKKRAFATFLRSFFNRSKKG